MIRALRRTTLARVLLPFAMLVCLVTVSVSALLHSEDDDALCGVLVEHHDHSAHRIGAPKAPSSEADHCFICHNQSLRSLVSTVLAVSACLGESRHYAEHGVVAGVELPRQQPARAPPLA